MKTERFSLASASDVAVFDTLVKVIRFDEGSAGGLPVIIKVKSLSGGAYEVELKPGRQITLPEVTRGVVISNLSGAAVTGKITIGAGMVTDNAIVGEVSVIDGGRARTAAGIAYSGAAYSAQGAGVYSHIQVWNPAGSGKNLIVGQFNGLYLVGTSGITVTQHNAALTTLYAEQPGNKKLGGAAGVAELRTQQNAAPLGSANRLYGLSNGAVLEPKEPIIVAPGWGLVFRRSQVNEDIQAGGEWFEDPV